MPPMPMTETLKKMLVDEKDEKLWSARIRLASNPPAKPPSCMTRLAKHWKNMFEGVMECENPVPKADPPPFLRPLSYALGNLPPGTKAVPSPRNEGDNWCGAVRQANNGRRFTEITGRLHIPVTFGDPPKAMEPVRCSAWIGLDGAFPSSYAMPQVGVTFGWSSSGGAPMVMDACVWFQWWVRNKWTPPFRLTKMQVEPGHAVLCHLLVPTTERTTVRVYVKNECTKEIFGIEADAPDNIPVDGRTAQWIVERPGDPEAVDLNRQLYDLPRFKSVVIDDCAARAVNVCDPNDEVENPCLARRD